MRTLTVSDPALVGMKLTPQVPASCAAIWWADDLAPLGDNAAVGGSGATWVDRVNSIALGQTTSASRPSVDIDGANGRPSLNFDGTNDYLTVNNLVSSTTKGCVVAVVRVVSPNVYQAFWSSADNASTSRYLFGLTETGPIEVQQNNGGTYNAVKGSASLVANTLTILEWASNDTAYELRVNNAVQSLSTYSGSNSGDWFGDTSSRDHFAMGALQRSNLSAYLTGRIAFLCVCNTPLSSGDRAALYGWLSSYYGISV